MPKKDSDVVGYFAIYPPHDILCDGDACIVAGTQSALNNYITSIANSNIEFDKRKTRFGEILEGMAIGGAYAFDEKAYNLFYPLANKNGFSLKSEIFSSTETGMHFVVVRQTIT